MSIGGAQSEVAQTDASELEAGGRSDVLGASAFPLGIESHARRQDSLTCAECSCHLDDHPSCRPPGLEIGKCVTHLLERKDFVDQRQPKLSWGPHEFNRSVA